MIRHWWQGLDPYLRIALVLFAGAGALMLAAAYLLPLLEGW